MEEKNPQGAEASSNVQSSTSPDGGADYFKSEIKKIAEQRDTARKELNEMRAKQVEVEESAKKAALESAGLEDLRREVTTLKEKEKVWSGYEVYFKERLEAARGALPEAVRSKLPRGASPVEELEFIDVLSAQLTQQQKTLPPASSGQAAQKVNPFFEKTRQGVNDAMKNLSLEELKAMSSERFRRR